MRVCVCVCARAHVFVCERDTRDVCICERMSVCVCVCMCVCVYSLNAIMAILKRVKKARCRGGHLVSALNHPDRRQKQPDLFRAPSNRALK